MLQDSRTVQKCRYSLQDLLDEDMPELPEDGNFCEPYSILEFQDFWIGKRPKLTQNIMNFIQRKMKMMNWWGLMCSIHSSLR